MFKRETTAEPIKDFASLLKPIPTKEVLSKMARTDLEIEQIKKDAFEEGLADGRATGYPQGRDIGYEDGHQEGLEKAYEEASQAKKAELNALVERSVSKVDSAITRWFEGAEPGLAALSILIAERIVAKELATDPETILSIVKEAVAEVTHATRATIKVRLADSELLEAHRSGILATAPSIKSLEIVADEDLVGGCVIETDGGIVDATLDMKFAELLESIRRAA